MARCFRCKSPACIKNGLMQGQQRYKCNSCGYNFVDKPRRGHSFTTHIFALWLYLGGLPLNRISKLFGVTSVAAMKWIKRFSCLHAQVSVTKRGKTRIISIDEMCSMLRDHQNAGEKGVLVIMVQHSAVRENIALLVKEPDVSEDLKRYVLKHETA